MLPYLREYFQGTQLSLNQNRSYYYHGLVPLFPHNQPPPLLKKHRAASPHRDEEAAAVDHTVAADKKY